MTLTLWSTIPQRPKVKALPKCWAWDMGQQRPRIVGFSTTVSVHEQAEANQLVGPIDWQQQKGHTGQKQM